MKFSNMRILYLAIDFTCKMSSGLESVDSSVKDAVTESEELMRAENKSLVAAEESQASQPVRTVTSIKGEQSKRKPARVQVDPSTVDEEKDRPPQTGTVFNIWYQKWSGGDKEDANFSQRKADGRCNIERDSGYTKADKVPGSYFCLYFARGLCTNGRKCEYLHRLPTVTDLFAPNVDSFGRDRFSDYRDDMGGVGSFLRQNRTLYVGRVNIRDDMEEVVYRHFTEWGEIERVRVLNSRGVAFVTYLNECNAQFAKEAMAHQSLDDNEVLNVRWATEDPNPMAKVREKRRLEEQAAEAIRKILPADYVAELEGTNNNEAKRKRIKDSSFGLDGYEAPDELWYNKGENTVNKKLIQGSESVDGTTQQPYAEAPVEEDSNLEEATEVQSSKETEIPTSSLLSSVSLDKLHALKSSGLVKNSMSVSTVQRSSALVSGYDSD
jgi:RNA recognition motif-containing protein